MKLSYFSVAIATALLSTSISANTVVITQPSEQVISESGLTSSMLQKHIIVGNVTQIKIDAMMASGLYRSVEIDSVAKTPKQTNLPPLGERQVTEQSTFTFNDTFYFAQTYFLTPDKSPDGIGITKAQELVIPYRPMMIGVIDSEFNLALNDISFRFGLDAVDKDSDATASETCTDRHGTQVASVVAANRNNSSGIAGINDAEVVPVRALDCGLGFISNVAEGLYYLAGADVGYGETLDTPVDVINMSLGAEVQCPSFLQNAINYAVERGIPVIVAAGNESIDASLSAPGNCQNVITVGALDADEAGVDQLPAYFTNYGTRVDISVKGTSVPAIGNDNDAFFVDGTSFSAPIVSGVVGMMKQAAPNLTPAEIELAIKMASTPYLEGSQCDTLGCGDGRLNALAATQIATNISDAGWGTVSSALFQKGLCTNDLAYSTSNDKLEKICGAFQIEFPAFDNTTGLTVNIFSGASKRSATVIESFEYAGLSRLSDAPIEGFEYFVQFCSESECSDLMDINVSYDVPDFCK
jgi:hypothetical protein